MSQKPIFIPLIHVEPLRNEKSLKKYRFFDRVPPGTAILGCFLPLSVQKCPPRVMVFFSGDLW